MLKDGIKALGIGLALGAGALGLASGHVDFTTAGHAATIYNENATPPPSTDNAASNVAALNALNVINQAMILLVKQVSPTVVSIYTTSVSRAQNLPPEYGEMERYFGMMPFELPPQKRQGLGSGFVINAEEGYVVTNAHVVRDHDTGKNADEIMVKFSDEDTAKGHPAKIIGIDVATDVALIKLNEPRPGMKAATLGDSSLVQAGEFVFAIGSPLGYAHSAVQGVVSAADRALEGGPYAEFIQTSAGINQGNSGGPLINVKGEVIGINTAMDARAGNIGFAIPINLAKSVIDQIKDGGRVHRAALGIQIVDIDESLRVKDKNGVLVGRVMPESPAARAGLKSADIIRKMGGQVIHNSRELLKALSGVKVGQTVDVEVEHIGGDRETFKVKLGENP